MAHYSILNFYSALQLEIALFDEEISVEFRVYSDGSAADSSLLKNSIIEKIENGALANALKFRVDISAAHLGLRSVREIVDCVVKNVGPQREIQVRLMHGYLGKGIPHLMSWLRVFKPGRQFTLDMQHALWDEREEQQMLTALTNNLVLKFNFGDLELMKQRWQRFDTGLLELIQTRNSLLIKYPFHKEAILNFCNRYSMLKTAPRRLVPAKKHSFQSASLFHLVRNREQGLPRLFKRVRTEDLEARGNLINDAPDILEFFERVRAAHSARFPVFQEVDTTQTKRARLGDF